MPRHTGMVTGRDTTHRAGLSPAAWAAHRRSAGRRPEHSIQSIGERARGRLDCNAVDLRRQGGGERIQRRPDDGAHPLGTGRSGVRALDAIRDGERPESVTARALGTKPQLRVIEGGARDVRQPLDDGTIAVVDSALTA